MQHDRIALDTHLVTSRIDALKRTFPELTEDAELLAATIEGETDFERVMDRLIEFFLDQVTMKEAVTNRMSDLRERGERYERKADTAKRLMRELMQASGQTTLRLPVATLSVREGSQAVEITDERMLPQGFFTRVPNKAAIKSAILAGEPPPGAVLVKGEDTLSIRTK